MGVYSRVKSALLRWSGTINFILSVVVPAYLLVTALTVIGMLTLFPVIGPSTGGMVMIYLIVSSWIALVLCALFVKW